MPAGGAFHLPTGPLHGRDDLFGFLRTCANNVMRPG
jgi:hypothetical protein